MHAVLNFEPGYLVLKLVFRGLSKNRVKLRLIK